MIFGLNYNLSAIQKMSKKSGIPSTNRGKGGKKEINEQVLARFDIEPVDINQSSSRRRLKKLCEINESQQLLDHSGEQDNLFDDPEEQPKYKQFKLKDDAELQRQKEEEEIAKKNKKLKGNQQLDKFIQKQSEKEKQKKEDKPKAKPIQMTIQQMMRIKKDKQKRRKSSDDFIISDNGEVSEEIDERQIQIKRLVAYEKYNGSCDDEQKLIQKAMKLSLTATSVQKHQNLEDYAFQNIRPSKIQSYQKYAKIQEPVKKQKQKQKQKQARKQVKKTKSMTKQDKTGPLAGFYIVFTGQFQGYDKDRLIEVCEQLGAQCPKTLVKKSNLLIQGSFVADRFKRKSSVPIDETAKSKQARERGIEIIQNNKIDDFFIQKTGFCLDHHLNKNKVEANPISSFLYKPIQSLNASKEASSVGANINKQQKEPKYQKMDIQKQKSHPLNAIKDQRLWTEKYKPTRLQEVIGQSGQIKALREWFEGWQDIHLRGNKREVKESKGGWNAAGNINSFAALLSGDPGIGKTSTARLLAMEYNYSVTEYNASDIRNKSGVNLLEKGSYNLDITRNLTKSLIIMDEVDGMSSGDRGGITAIINMIKSTKVPIICICNDRASEKIRSLALHCHDIKFHKPNKGMIVKRLRQILIQQGGSGQQRALEQLVQTFQNDMRQILSYLQVIFKTVSRRITIDALSSRSRSSKDASVMINHFDASRTLLNKTEFSRMRIHQRTDCFFVDSDMVPLMVHQNLLASARKSAYGLKEFHSIVQGVDGFVVGDLLDRCIRKQQEWGLMPSYGFMTCVYAPEKISQSIGFPQFPAWLGKNSSERKMKRLSKELKDAIFINTLNGSWKAAKNLYVPLITGLLSEFLKKEQIQQAVVLMEQYNLTPAMLTQHLSTLYYSTDKSNPLSEIPGPIRAKVTRLFNKRHQDAKLRQATKAKGKVDHVKFNPIMQEMEQALQQQEEEGEEQQKIESVKVKGKGKQAKNRKK